MICGPGYTYIDNPKTASTSVYRALLDHSYGRTAGDRHLPPSYIVWNTPRLFFTNIRNPFDRLVSAWTYRGTGEPFAEWLRGAPYIIGGVDVKRTSQGYWAGPYTRVIRFERLEEDFAAFLKAVNLPLVDIGHEKKTNRPPYREVISQADRVLIEDRFAFDLSEWGYTF